MIRPAVPDDEPIIRAIVDDAYAKYVSRIGMRPLPMDDDYAARIRNGQAHVLVDRDRIAGVIVLVDGDGHLLVDNVAVAPSAQGRGLGKRLLAFAEEEARRRDMAELRLYTNVKMTENRALYASLGFVEESELTIAGRNAVGMRKPV